MVFARSGLRWVLCFAFVIYALPFGVFFFAFALASAIR
ncbi:hypothetical protein K788_0002282 [Paraburkholderia caribensis MBA4]|uniref:Uncharacterized protein n=1 Tax=Paraburkholderia caribensis MBA4 TaxID=1323664 RepID=A0A0N7JTW8_9BURK|nr:hypothetical protein K788_0002282 [Paraburkholderia caribensis MBA4]